VAYQTSSRVESTRSVNFAVGLAPETETTSRSLVFYSTLCLDSHLEESLYERKRERGGWEGRRSRGERKISREKIGADFQAWATETKLDLSWSSRIRADSCTRGSSRMNVKSGPSFVARPRSRQICKRFERNVHSRPRRCSFRRPDTRHCEKRPIGADGGSRNTPQWHSREVSNGKIWIHRSRIYGNFWYDPLPDEPNMIGGE